MKATPVNRRQFIATAAGTAVAQPLLAQGGEALPQARPKPPLEILGWDYDRLGHSLYPGEKVSLLFRNNRTGAAPVTIDWRLTTWVGETLATGKTDLDLAAGGTGGVPIPLPADLKDGGYFVRYTTGKDAREKLFHFDFRRPETDAALNLTVFALIESIDCKAWVRLMFGPLARYVTVLAEWPEDRARKVDAVLVMAEAIKPGDRRLERVRAHIEQGGTAVVFGKPGAALDPLLPVRLDASHPFLDAPARLKVREGGPWRGFRPETGPAHYGVRVQAKAGATVLAEWEGGAPAVVLGKSGKGRVVFVGAGSDQVWQRNPSLEGADEMALRLLYWLKGGDSAVAAMLGRAAQLLAQESRETNAVRDRVLAGVEGTRPRDVVVVSRNNAGRFAWLIGDNGLADNINHEGTVLPPGTRTFVIRGGSGWKFDVGPSFGFSAGGQRRPKTSEVRQNWFAKTISWRYEDGATVRSTVSLGSPAILWEGDAVQAGLTCASVTHVAYAAAGGVRVAARGEAIRGADMTEPWLVLFTADAAARDLPLLVVLTKRADSVRLDEGLQFVFGQGGFGAMFTSRLFGIRRLAPGETVEWAKRVPDDAVAAARRWPPAFHRYPVDCDEIGWLEGETVVVADRFRYRDFASAWGVKPRTVAPLAPVLALARMAGAPVGLPGEAADLHFPTKLGPLYGVEGDTTVVRLPLPCRDHRALIPAEGRMVLREDIDRSATGLRLEGRLHPDHNVRNEGGGDLHADLAQYDIANTVPHNETPCIDVYKWWYTFNAILARPVYSPAMREKVDRYFRLRYQETLNFYPHKCLVRQKRDPLSKVEYIIHFVWPTQTQYGFRHFNDGNEASGVAAYCFTSYARYYGDWTTLSANWNHCRRLYEFLPRVNDWACMCSGAHEHWTTAGFDMLNSEPWGNLVYAYAAERCGTPHDVLMGQVLGARALVPTVARLALAPYLRAITADGDEWRSFKAHYHFMEEGILASPNKLGAIGMLDTSKGTSHELCLAYKQWVGKAMRDEQKAQEDASAASTFGRSSFPDLTQRLILGWDPAALLEKAKTGLVKMRERPLNWQAAKDLYDLGLLCIGNTPLFLSEWTPAEYVAGRHDEARGEVELVFRSRDAAPFTVKVYSQREAREVALDGSPLRTGWRWDAASGWLTVELKGTGEKRLRFRLGEPKAPLHAYFTKVG